MTGEWVTVIVVAYFTALWWLLGLCKAAAMADAVVGPMPHRCICTADEGRNAYEQA